MKLYKFIDTSGNEKGVLPIKWPIRIWQCYIPKNINPNINILEELILSLIDTGAIKTKEELFDFLGKKLQFNEILFKNVWEHCEYNYLQKKNDMFVVKKDIKEELKVIQEGLTPEMNMSSEMEKIYLFQDGVSGNVVPCFNISKLDMQRFYVDDKHDVVVLDDIGKKTQPKANEIYNAIKQWGNIVRSLREGEALKDSNSNETESESNEDEQKKSLHKIEYQQITILDDTPQLCWMAGFIRFNINDVENPQIMSPLGKEFDWWFSKLFKRFCDSGIVRGKSVPEFLEECQIEFEEQIATANALDIPLFEEFPNIVKMPAYAYLKKSIQDVAKDISRMKHGEDESNNFAKNMRTALEVLFRTVLDANPEIGDIRKKYAGKDKYGVYCYDIETVIALKKLNLELEHLFKTRGIYDNLIHNKKYPKDIAALLLVYARYNLSSKVADIITEYETIFPDMFKLYRVGTEAGHALEQYMHGLSVQDAEQYYGMYEVMVRILFGQLVQGEENE